MTDFKLFFRVPKLLITEIVQFYTEDKKLLLELIKGRCYFISLKLKRR